MNAAMEMESRKHPDKEIVPAALLYYHIDDPTIETPVELSEMTELLMGTDVPPRKAFIYDHATDAELDI